MDPIQLSEAQCWRIVAAQAKLDAAVLRAAASIREAKVAHAAAMTAAGLDVAKNYQVNDETFTAVEVEGQG
jgi:hypothetical protein